MPAPLVGRKFGVNIIPPPEKEKAKDIKVLGISGSSRQEAGMSKSERLLLHALEQYTGYAAGPVYQAQQT